jgi:hypothetical protein
VGYGVPRAVSTGVCIISILINYIQMDSYYELELPPHGDLLKGELVDSCPKGPALYFSKRQKLLTLGTITSSGTFDGPGVVYDFSDAQQTTVYYG